VALPRVVRENPNRRQIGTISTGACSAGCVQTERLHERMSAIWSKARHSIAVPSGIGSVANEPVDFGAYAARR